MIKNTIRIITLILLLLPLKAFLQGYIAFPDSGAVWKETYYYFPGPYWYNAIGDTYLLGDTIFNDTTYRKIYNLRRDVFCSDIIIQNPEFGGALREDTLNQKIYLRGSEDYPEVLMYDYTLQVGDTLPEEIFAYYDDIFVSYIDTITTRDSIKRRVWYFDHEVPFVGWSNIIEGIGCSSGLTGFIEPYFEGWNELLCFSVDGHSVWSARNTCYVPSDSCAPLGLNESLHPQTSIRFYPNPVGNSSTISFELGQIHTEKNFLWIYDLYGKEVSLLEFSDEIFSIESPASKGIYIIKIFVNNQYHISKLIVSD